MKGKSILLVEGEADKLFFEHVFRKIGLDVIVKVTTPTEHRGIYDTKGAVFTTVPLLLEQMNDGSLTRFSVVIDADLTENGTGHQATLESFTTLLRESGFTTRHRVGENGGYLFHHNNGLKPVGLWIMPDNHNDGTIEDMIKASVAKSQRDRFDYAIKVVDGGVKPFLFRIIHTVKAEVATWLACQRIPGQGIFACVRDELVDFENEGLSRLVRWLKTSYTEPHT